MKQWLKSNRGFLVLLVCFGVFRTAIADWNPVPSGSMRPTILEGDVVLVNRLAYDLKIPLTGMANRRSFDPVAVPADYYFMLGDNRDNSGDSRYFGPVPRSLLIARAERILVSADITTNWVPRWERFASRLQ